MKTIFMKEGGKRKDYEMELLNPPPKVNRLDGVYEEDMDEINKKIELEEKLSQKIEKKIKKTKLNFL